MCNNNNLAHNYDVDIDGDDCSFYLMHQATKLHNILPVRPGNTFCGLCMIKNQHDVLLTCREYIIFMRTLVHCVI